MLLNFSQHWLSPLNSTGVRAMVSLKSGEPWHRRQSGQDCDLTALPLAEEWRCSREVGWNSTIPTSPKKLKKPLSAERDWAWKSRAGHCCRQGISLASVHKSRGNVQANPILNSFCTIGGEAVCRSGTCTQELTLGWQQLLQERAREHLYRDPKEHFGELCVSWRFNVL